MRKDFWEKPLSEEDDPEEEALQTREAELNFDIIEECAMNTALRKNNLLVRESLAVGLGAEEDLLRFIANFKRGKSIVHGASRKRRSDILIAQMARLELKRLLDGGKTHCKHSIDDHKKALLSIIAKLPDQAPSKAN